MIGKAGASRPNRPAALVGSLMFLIAACSSGGPQPSPRIDRLPAAGDAGSPALPAPSLPTSPSLPPAMSVASIATLARAGSTPDEMVDRWRRDGARLKLKSADIVDLHARGVSSAILDALLEAQEIAMRVDFDSRLAAQQGVFDQQLAAERARVPVCPAPPYWGPRPYGGWGPGGWWGGASWGW